MELIKCPWCRCEDLPADMALACHFCGRIGCPNCIDLAKFGRQMVGCLACRILAAIRQNYPVLLPKRRQRTTVANVSAGEEFDVYIGRGGQRGLPVSPYRNTFPAHAHGRRAALALYLENLTPDLVERARKELTGKVLGCHCKPADCHGDILAACCDLGPGEV